MQNPRMISTNVNNSPMDLAPNLELDFNELVGKQLAVFGMPGYGKTNAVALLLEQISPYLAPMAIFDKEGDFGSCVDLFPRGVLASANNCPSGRDILEKGLQVVYDLPSWDDDHTRADVMVAIVSQLLDYVNSRPSSERVPCVIVVDEAQYWLPENRGSHLKRSEFLALSTAFQTVGSTGRKRGFTPFYACPKISELAKSILYPGMYMFFRATLHTDVKRYLEYVHSNNLTPAGLKKYVETMPAGRAIIKLPSGKQRMVTLHMRQSEHISHTPNVQAALNKYSDMPFNPNENYGMFLPEAQPEPVFNAPIEVRVIAETNEALVKAGLRPHVNGELSMNNPEFASLALSQRFRMLYSLDPQIDGQDLSIFCGCEQHIASAWLSKQKAPANHVVQGRTLKAPVNKVKKVMSTPLFDELPKATRVRMIMTADPSLQTADIAQLLKSDTTSISRIRSKIRMSEGKQD